MIERLFAGSLDIVGDVHGEIDALHSLLEHLGYRDGDHATGRRLVFVGDLCDRGPDSVAVVELVQRLVERGGAQCILGNHELNVLRGDAKAGNRWIIDPAHAENASFGSRTASAEQREAISAFFRTLPIALERDDLRIVHATWHEPSITTLRTETESNIGAFSRHETSLESELAARGLLDASNVELDAHRHALGDAAYPMPLLSAVGRCDELRQMLNPVRVLTSGPERATPEQFFASGKWRFCDRVKWWNEYTDSTPVVFGHYWRGLRADGDDKPYLFEGLNDVDWAGPQRNVYCVDFSVGARYRERKTLPSGPFTTRLAALRWPERTVTFDDGQVIDASG